jgi:hypothetical protein
MKLPKALTEATAEDTPSMLVRMMKEKLIYSSHDFCVLRKINLIKKISTKALRSAQVDLYGRVSYG